MLLLGHWLVAGDLHVLPGNSSPVPSDYQRDTNWALFDSTLTAMRKADPNPQVVILSGDFLAHHFPRNVRLAESMMARMAQAFNAAFPKAQFVIVPGNNDDPCGDYRVTPGSAYFLYLAHIWAPLVNRNGAAPRFEHDFGQYGWYAARAPGANVEFLALNSVYWSFVYRRCGNYHPNAPQRQFQWLAHSLNTLPAGRHAVIVMHIPPGVDASTTLETHRLVIVPFLSERNARTLTRMLSAHAARIGFALAAHVHRDDFRLFGGVPMLIAPSISPIYGNNPAFLRLDVEADGTLRDYTPFAYDDEFSGDWQARDSFDRTFGTGAFTAQSLALLHARLAQDPDLRARWARMYVAGSTRREVDPADWRTYWCAQTQLVSAFPACAGVQYRVTLFPIAAGLAGAAVLAIVVLLLMRLARQRRAR